MSRLTKVLLFGLGFASALFAKSNSDFILSGTQFTGSSPAEAVAIKVTLTSNAKDEVVLDLPAPLGRCVEFSTPPGWEQGTWMDGANSFGAVKRAKVLLEPNMQLTDRVTFDRVFSKIAAGQSQIHLVFHLPIIAHGERKIVLPELDVPLKITQEQASAFNFSQLVAQLPQQFEFSATALQDAGVSSQPTLELTLRYKGTEPVLLAQDVSLGDSCFRLPDTQQWELWSSARTEPRYRNTPASPETLIKNTQIRDIVPLDKYYRRISAGDMVLPIEIQIKLMVNDKEVPVVLRAKTTIHVTEEQARVFNERARLQEEKQQTNS